MRYIGEKQTCLSTNDISSILNLICPRCGGPLGEPSRQFMCQGRCRKDWRADWEGNGLSRSQTRNTGRSSTKRTAYVM